MADPRLIGISGYARAGKDTLASAFVELGWSRASFAEPLKQMLLALDPIIGVDLFYGVDFDRLVLLSEVVDSTSLEAAKDNFPEVRRLLQRLGTEAGRGVLGEDIWVNTAMQNTLDGGQYVFADCRFPNEAAAIQAADGIVIRVDRLGVVPSNGHSSDTAVDDITFDYVVHNDGTVAELQAKAAEILVKERKLRQVEMAASGTPVAWSERELFRVDL